MTATTTAPRPPATAGRDGFAQVLHAEWTKFRTVRGWIIGIIVAALVTIALGVLTGGSAQIGCQKGPNGPQLTGKACEPAIPVGPGGEPVSDSYYLAGQPLAGHGAITARVTALAGQEAAGGGSHQEVGTGPELTPGLVPWAKAGIIITASTRPGAAYAAMMVTGANGVRMQYDYTHDIAGLPGRPSAAAPRWLRLTRSGDVITGYDSADGRHWSLVGTATLAGLPRTATAGLFATSPNYMQVQQGFGTTSGEIGPSVTTGTFDQVRLQGAPAGAAWTGTRVGGDRTPGSFGSLQQDGNQFTVTGTGNIAPLGTGLGYPSASIESHLMGAFAGLIAVIVVGAMFITAEYRRGLILVTLAASPRRGPVLAAKAIVIAAAAFAAGLVAAIVSVIIGTRLASDQGLYIVHVSPLTAIRVVGGTAAVLAVAGVMAVAVGALARRSAVAVTVVIVAIVMPYILAVAAVLPASAGDWLLRVTPAAGFAIQQSVVAWPQVTGNYTPSSGYFPLPWWGGFAVMCGFAALALVLAVRTLSRRDA